MRLREYLPTLYAFSVLIFVVIYSYIHFDSFITFPNNSRLLGLVISFLALIMSFSVFLGSIPTIKSRLLAGNLSSNRYWMFYIVILLISILLILTSMFVMPPLTSL